MGALAALRHRAKSYYGGGENLNESLVIREALPGPERGNLFPQE
jgi:hypothetical protein